MAKPHHVFSSWSSWHCVWRKWFVCFAFWFKMNNDEVTQKVLLAGRNKTTSTPLPYNYWTSPKMNTFKSGLQDGESKSQQTPHYRPSGTLLTPAGWPEVYFERCCMWILIMHTLDKKKKKKNPKTLLCSFIFHSFAPLRNHTATSTGGPTHCITNYHKSSGSLATLLKSNFSQSWKKKNHVPAVKKQTAGGCACALLGWRTKHDGRRSTRHSPSGHQSLPSASALKLCCGLIPV